MAGPIPHLKPSSPQKQHNRGTGPTSTNTVSLTRTRGHAKLTEADLLELAYGVPSLHTSPNVQSSSNASSQAPPTTKHDRSMSHPFPSLFHSRQKRQGINALSASDSSDGDNHILPSQSASRIVTSKHTRPPDKILVTGKCMTCDSTVRWPKELLVFRCTVCLTINDLKPQVATSPDGNTKGTYTLGGETTITSLPQISKVMPLSTTKTRALIEQCITVYLLDRLAHDERVESQKKSPNSSFLLDHEATEMAIPKHKSSRNLPSKTSPRSLKMVLTAKSGAIVDESPRFIHYNDDIDSSSAPYLSPATPYNNYSLSHDSSKDSPGLRHTTNLDIANATRKQVNGTKSIFRLLEDYIVTSFMSRECVNSSFITSGPVTVPCAVGEGTRLATVAALGDGYRQASVALSGMDAKTLLIGNFAENGAWWAGEGGSMKGPDRSRLYQKNPQLEAPDWGTKIVNIKSPKIDWAELGEWYDMVLHAGIGWKRQLYDLIDSDASSLWREFLTPNEMDQIENQISEARLHTQRVLLKATESLLKRPGAPLKQPDDIRFLLVILANPLLCPSYLSPPGKHLDRFRSRPGELLSANVSADLDSPRPFEFTPLPESSQDPSTGPGQHSSIIKRVLGLLSNLPNECHHHLVAWFARFSESHFQRTTEMVGSFVTYRLTRQHGKQKIMEQDHNADLIPSFGTVRYGASAALHATLGTSGQHTRKSNGRPRPMTYNDDWQIRAAARVMALLFSANNIGAVPKGDSNSAFWSPVSNRAGVVTRENTDNHGQILAISSFYNTLLDYSDLVADFEAWESGRSKFAFCQYPFFLSIWAKIQIMEHDARRQMEVKAREAFFDSIMTRKTVNQYLFLKIRRECLVEDSLKGVSEVVGSGGEEIKKGLRIEFKGEEGIDAGGLRKEWFLLLVRDVFNPDHGMFIYDEDSHFCYFNPNSFETSDQYFLVGVVLGLAIYNSTILDVALPSFAFRKLVAAGPTAAPGAPCHAKPAMTYCLEDLAELRPALASGLRQLLEYEGNVEDTFCRDFVADVERYGQVVQIPLCPNGENIPVTNANRQEFVDLYVRYLLDTAVSRQFEPFKRGFFTVCGGNALSLFRPEEIELLIRGSDEPLDITSLQAVAIYENWGIPNAAETEPVIGWFWSTFQQANPKDQRKLLSFITGSDRIPAMGAASLVIKLSCLGDDSLRFPVARTCFNMLSLWRYSSRERLESMLWRAVNESEGFGLK